MKCKYCGYSIAYGAKFCENCGSAVNVEDMDDYSTNDHNQQSYGGSQYQGYNNQYGNQDYNNQYGNGGNQGYNNQYGYDRNQGYNNQYGYGSNQNYNNQYGYDQYQGYNNQYGYYPPVYNQGEGSPRYVDFIEALKLFFKNYANFNGRSTRSEYWFAYLFNAIIGFVLVIFVAVCAVTTSIQLIFTSWVIAMLVWGALICPTISCGVRRLHDIGKEGTYYLFSLIPYAGPIILIVWFCKPSVGPNQWGYPAAPKNSF